MPVIHDFSQPRRPPVCAPARARTLATLKRVLFTDGLMVMQRTAPPLSLSLYRLPGVVAFLSSMCLHIMSLHS